MTDTEELRAVVDRAFARGAEINEHNADGGLRNALDEVVARLNDGRLRAAEKSGGRWTTHEWVKRAILLCFRVRGNAVVEGRPFRYFDKMPMKFESYTEGRFREQAARVVPPAVVRDGSYVGRNVVLMPCYLNIGAYVDDGTMVDTWATVGSCAQIGKNVHLSGGVGIGGVLEPIQAAPTIIEDNCFIGARSEIAEGVIVEENAVIAMGVFIGQSTRIYDRETGETWYGRVPAGSVVVPGSLPSADGKFSIAAAIIVKKVDARTRLKTAINELVRG